MVGQMQPMNNKRNITQNCGTAAGLTQHRAQQCDKYYDDILKRPYFIICRAQQKEKTK